MKHKLLLLLLVCVAFSCDKEEPMESLTPINPNAQDTIPYTLLWEKFMYENDSLQYGFEDTYLYNNTLVLNRDRTFVASEADNVYARDPYTGEIIWEWNDWPAEHYVEDIATFENYYMFNYQDYLYCIDVNTGETVWSKEPSGEFGLDASYFATGENVYMAHHNPDRSNTLVQLKIKTGETREIYTSYSEGDVETNLKSASEGINSNGDTIIVFQDRKYDQPQPLEDEVWVQLLAYNLTADSLLWKIDTLEAQSISSVAVSPIFDGDIVYFAGNSIHAISLNTGWVKWSTKIEQSPMWSFVLYRNRLFASRMDSVTFCIDPETGEILWENDLNGGSFTSFLTYKDYLLVCSKQIYYINIFTGETDYILPYYNRRIDLRVSFLGKQPSMSQDGKYVYISDTFFDICFENPAY